MEENASTVCAAWLMPFCISSKRAVNGGICQRIFRSGNWFIIIIGAFETTGVIEIIHDQLREQVRVKKGKQVSPSLGLVDSQSVKTASVTTEKGVDGNKKGEWQKEVYLD